MDGRGTREGSYDPSMAISRGVMRLERLARVIALLSNLFTYWEGITRQTHSALPRTGVSVSGPCMSVAIAPTLRSALSFSIPHDPSTPSLMKFL